jgi:broad specificity phosphatase PhoE
MYLLLMRHGETDWNLEGRMQGRIDTPLNARGREQAEKLAERLAVEECIDVLYTSPLARARLTAEIIGKKFGLDPFPDVRLVERSAGELEGMTMPEIEKRYPDVYCAWREDKDRLILPGAEDKTEFQLRVLSFLDLIRERHAHKRVGVVTHGGTLSILFATLMGLDIEERFPFRFDNASLSKVDLSRRRPRIDLLNDSCHLRAAGMVIRAVECEEPLTELPGPVVTSTAVVSQLSPLIGNGTA